MKFSVGDEVKFIDAVGGGKIVAIQDEHTVVLLNDDGFEIPVDEHELMFTGKSIAPESETVKPTAPPQQTQTPQVFKPLSPQAHHPSDINLLLAFVPQNEPIESSDMSLYLINDSLHDILFQISIKFNHQFQLLEANRLEANTQILLTTIERQHLGNITHLFFQGFIILSHFKTAYPAIEKEIPLRSKRFFTTNAFKKTVYFKEPIIEYRLFHSNFSEELHTIADDEYDKIAKQENEPRPVEIPKKSHAQEPIEVNLHIEELIDDHRNLSNAEIINIQLSHFQTELESAMASQAERIIFIHGVGKGRLKQEIINKLKQDYPKLSYQDASFKEYGYGATMVFLR